MPLKIETTDSPSGRVVSVAGEVDMDSSPELRRELIKQLKDHPALGVDLSGVGYIDSSGIAVLIEGQNISKKAGADLVLLKPSEAVSSVIELAFLNGFFKIESGGAA